MSGGDQDLIEVVIACSCGQIGRDAAREIISELDLAGFGIVRKRDAQDQAMQELADQAQALNMGYGQRTEQPKNDPELHELHDVWRD